MVGRVGARVEVIESFLQAESVQLWAEMEQPPGGRAIASVCFAARVALARAVMTPAPAAPAQPLSNQCAFDLVTPYHNEVVTDPGLAGESAASNDGTVVG
jgi:hypothetical protein